jgi:hypothetical protein
MEYNTMTNTMTNTQTPIHEFSPAFTEQEIFERNQKALAYLVCVDVARGRSAGASALKPEPRTLLRVPCKVPAAAMARIVEHVFPPQWQSSTVYSPSFDL